MFEGLQVEDNFGKSLVSHTIQNMLQKLIKNYIKLLNTLLALRKRILLQLKPSENSFLYSLHTKNYSKMKNEPICF